MGKRSDIKYIRFILLYSAIIFNCISTFSSDSTSYSGYYNFIYQDFLGLNDEYETPYYVFKGKDVYTPVMILDGGIHGDEIASYMACDSIVKYIRVTEGTLIVIPRTNIKACNINQRQVNFDFNHAFPGDITSDLYEYRLAYEFMWLVDSVKPDLIINLHEARTKWTPSARYDSEKAYGQIIISCIQPFEDLMMRSISRMNSRIYREDFKFNPHYYSIREYSSLDNFVLKFGIKSYTVETWRGFALEDRIKLQLIAALSFMEELGIKYEYPQITF
jgi:predicted deacylase